MTRLKNRRSTLLLVFLLSAISLGLFVSCTTTDGDDPITPPEYAITIEEIPEALPVDIDIYFPIVIQLEPSNPDVDSLYCAIYNPEDGLFLEFYLYDDGSAFDHPSESSLLSVRSGDNVPGDSRFTREITGKDFENDFGIYTFNFITPDGNSFSDSIDIQPVEAPSFTDVTLITNFPSGFSPVELEARINKPTSSDRIDSVALEITYADSPLRRIHFEATSGDTLWTLTLSPGHFWGIPTWANYEFRFVLWDRFGLTADTTQFGISIENGPPIVSNPMMPDTIWRPRLGEPNDTTVITVQADDPETLRDIATVRFEVRKVWQTEWSGGDDFYLLDLGGRWDDVAGDGVYSVPLVTKPSDSLTNNIFYFRFFAIDFTQDTSNYVIDSVRVIEPVTIL
ncbi:hypothetical protein KKG05_05115 [bacterium]|nr:hypothetical protein [bacterium]